MSRFEQFMRDNRAMHLIMQNPSEQIWKSWSNSCNHRKKEVNNIKYLKWSVAAAVVILAEYQVFSYCCQQISQN